MTTQPNHVLRGNRAFFSITNAVLRPVDFELAAHMVVAEESIALVNAVTELGLSKTRSESIGDENFPGSALIVFINPQGVCALYLCTTIATNLAAMSAM